MRINLLSLLALFIWACHTPHKAVDNTTDVKSKTGSYLTDHHNLTDNEIKERQKFIEAQKSEILGDAQQAINLFNEVVKLDPANDAAWYELSKLHIKGYRYPPALSAAVTAYHLDYANHWYARQVAECYAVNNRFKEAANVYAGFLKKYPDNPEMYYEWALMLQQAHDANAAIAVYEKLEKLTGIDENITHEKVKLFMRMGKKDKAVTELEKLNDAFPNTPDYLGELADMYANTHQYEKAITVVKHILDINPMNDKAYLALSDYYRRIGKETESLDMLQKAFSNPSINPDIKVQILLFKARQGESNTIMKDLIRTLLNTHPNSSNAHNFYGDYLTNENKDSAAYIEYRTACKLNPKNPGNWENLILYNARKNHKDSMLAYSKQYVTLFPGNINAYYYLGLSFFQRKQYDSSVTYLKSGIGLGSDNKKLLAQMFGLVGESFHNRSKFTESDSAYEEALTYDPDDAGTLNNYAYYLSLRNKDLDKAASLSHKSNLLQPGSPSFLDTYGWILYKQGKLEEAKDYIKQAIDKGGNTHFDVLEHYGDVLYKSGDINGAVDYWKKARSINPGSAPILDKKIADKKLYD